MINTRLKSFGMQKKTVLCACINVLLATQISHAETTDVSNKSSKEKVLATIKVDAVSDKASTEQTKSYTVAQSTASTGLALSLKETPQSVTVVTRQQLDDKNAQTIGDVLAQTTGITFKEYDIGGRTYYRARGFDITNYKVDGLAILGESGFSGAGNSINMDLYDHVTIVRGANGLLGGTGDPSASIDLVRKLPTKDFTGSVKLRTGSWDKKGIVGDINMPLTQDGRVRSRLVVSAENSDGFRDHENIKRQGVLASIAMDVSDNTQLGFGYQYEHSLLHGASWGASVPIWYADGTRTNFSRKFNPVADWSTTERESNTFFSSLDSSFDNDWKLSTRYSHTARKDYDNFGVLKPNGSGTNPTSWSFWNQDGTGATLNAIHQEIESTSDVLSISLSGPFTLFGRQHNLMLGVDGSDTKSTSWTFNSSNCSIGSVTGTSSSCQFRTNLSANWLTWTGSEYPNIATYRTNARTVTYTTQVGGYLASRWSLMDNLSLIAGVRRSYYDTYADVYGTSGTRTTAHSSGKNVHAWTPYYGLVYDLTPNYSLYASYTDIFTPQSAQYQNGDVLDPITGQSYEAGIKGAWFDNNLNASFAVFKAKQKGLAIKDGSNTVINTTTQAYIAGTGRTSQGFEAEVSGALTQDWNIYAGYTYLGVKDSSTEDRDDPRHLVRLNTTYDLSNVLLQGLTVGAGMSWQSYTVSSPYPGRPVGTTFDTTAIKVNGYALYDAMIAYQINDHFSANFNVSNLLDKTYYRQFGFYDGLIYGEPRRFTLTLQAKF